MQQMYQMGRNKNQEKINNNNNEEEEEEELTGIYY